VGERNLGRKAIGRLNKKRQDKDEMDLRVERCTCEKRKTLRAVSNNGNEFVYTVSMVGLHYGIRIGRGN
jgi:hypothetical protein